MDTKEFLRAVLPSQGVYFAAVPNPGGKGFKHHACESTDELAVRCLQYDEDGATVYFATTAYREKQIIRSNGKPGQRVQENVKSARAFWFDLDVGDGKDYASQGDAVSALGKFLADSGLPVPILVNSGYGVHAYWPLKQDIMPAQWKATAENLKLLAGGLGLNADPARTADYASVLRAPGTHNRKNNEAREVSIFNEGAGPIEWMDFDRTIKAKITELKLVPKRETASDVANKLNEGAVVKESFPPAHADVIADRCNQIREFKDKGGNIKEPHWYAAIGLLSKTVEGEELVHEWSKGYSGYNKAETDQKLEQIKDFGPTTCKKFDAVNPGGCEGCPFAGQVTSPIALGVVLEEAPKPVVEVMTEKGMVSLELPNPPPPFSRGAGDQEGLYYDVEGVPVRFYEYDIYPVALEYDELDKFETTRVRHRLPLDGWKEFLLRTSHTVSPNDFNKAMSDASIKYRTEGKQKDTMRTYMTAYMKTLQQNTRLKTHHAQCGWKEGNTEFLLGNKMFKSDGTNYHSGLSRAVQGLGEAFKPVGEFEPWRKLTEQLAKPGYEQHAFTMSLAFGAPLLHLMGFHGVLVNMVGGSGSGKSTTAHWMFSVFGDFEKGISTDNTTALARLAKMATFGHLPMYIDELTKMEPKDVSNLAYSIANGAGRERLNADSSIQEVKRWNTFVLSSSNNHLHDKLQSDAGNPEAQTLRVFEYEFLKPTGYDAFVANELLPVLRKNYGHAGERYISFLVQQDKEKIRQLVEGWKATLDERFDAQGKERFWFYGAAVALAGASIAHAMGLVAYNPMRLIDWVGEQIQAMRAGNEENHKDEMDLLTAYLNETQAERLIVNEDTGMRQSAIVVKAPATHAKLTQRLVQDTGQLYISFGPFQKWLTSRGENIYQMAKKLRNRAVLVNDTGKAIKVSLGRYTEFDAGRAHVWQINMNHKDMRGILDEEVEEAV